MVHAGHVQPAEFVERGVDARVRRLGVILRVLVGVFELQLVPQVVPPLARRLAGDGETGEPFAPFGG